jgi:hypothetical protein
MTGKEAIEKTDALRPNALNFEQKLGWLSDLDGLAFREVVLTHEHNEGVTFEHYKNGEEELIIQPPDTDVYHHYLCMQIDLACRELTPYNNDKTMFNNTYLTWVDAYNREHMPIQQVKRWKL